MKVFVSVTVVPIPRRSPRTIHEAKTLGKLRLKIRGVAAEIAAEVEDLIARRLIERKKNGLD